MLKIDYERKIIFRDILDKTKYGKIYVVKGRYISFDETTGCDIFYWEEKKPEGFIESLIGSMDDHITNEVWLKHKVKDVSLFMYTDLSMDDEEYEKWFMDKVQIALTVEKELEDIAKEKILYITHVGDILGYI